MRSAGDDTDVRPVGWPALVQQRFARDPWLSVLALLDTRDPGFPSFPVVDVGRHLDLFQYMFPKCFLSGCINQGEGAVVVTYKVGCSLRVLSP